MDYIVAPPRMAHYMEWSTRVYDVYLKYVAPSDIHNYSIDEVLMDVTNYLDTYRLTARELAKRIVQDVLETTGITATAGIGTNLYLCKIAMDIWAKHTQPDADGVRIAELDEQSYRRNLWDTLAECGVVRRFDFWPALSALRGERGAAHRPRLGLGALHDGGDQGVPAGLQEHRVRAGSPEPLRL